MLSLNNWHSKKMKDYRQHLKMNCGGVATVFSLYGLNEEVPDDVIRKTLNQENVGAMQIKQWIDSGRRSGISATPYLLGSVIQTAGGLRKIKFLQALSSAAVQEEGLKDILTTNNARCLVVSCYVKGVDQWRNSWLYHWQTCYLPKNGSELKWYNAWPQWRLAVDSTHAGTPTGLILVHGPKIS